MEHNLLMREEALRGSIYARKGYANRWHYLKSLSSEYGIPFPDVVTLADILGPNEDFDGLLTELENIQFQT